MGSDEAAKQDPNVDDEKMQHDVECCRAAGVDASQEAHELDEARAVEAPEPAADAPAHVSQDSAQRVDAAAADTLDPEVESLVHKLEAPKADATADMLDPVADVRNKSAKRRAAAIEALSEQEATLIQHAPDIARRLERDKKASVKAAALKALLKLPAVELATYAHSLVEAVCDQDHTVHKGAFEALFVLQRGKLSAADVQQCAQAVAIKLDSSEDHVRRWAMDACGLLPVAVVSRHARAIANCLEDRQVIVRKQGVDLLGAIAEHSRKVKSQQAEDYEPYVLQAAFQRLGRCVTDPELSVRMGAVEAISKLDAPLKAKQATVVVRALTDQDMVKFAAVRVLSDLEPADLRDHLPAIQTQLGGGSTLLHLTAKNGRVHLVRSLAKRHRHALLHAKDHWQETPLHVAAREGYRSICEVLVTCGALVNARNGRSQTALDLARKARHEDVVAFLSSCQNITTIRGGTGDAWEQAIADDRPVVGVEWYTIAMPGLPGLLGAFHSLLAVTVSDETKAHTYVIEKAAMIRGGDERDKEDRCKNGVHVSHWLDVVANVDGHPIHVLERSDIHNDTKDTVLCMRTLRDLAVDLGPYDVGSCNCHHAALTMYNACAHPDVEVPSIPNETLTWGAHVLRSAGLDVTASNSVQSNSMQSTSVSMHSMPSSLPSGGQEAKQSEVIAVY